MSKIATRITGFFLVILLTLFSTFLLTSSVFAQAGTPADAIGTLDKPPGVEQYDAAAGIGEGEIGILYFISQMITVITIVAGLWSFLNIILAGFAYVTSPGGAQTHTKVRDKFTMSLLGLILIVTVYALGGLIGVIFFGDAKYILNPTIQGPPL